MPEALDDLIRHIAIAKRLGAGVMRICAGGRATRPQSWAEHKTGLLQTNFLASASSMSTVELAVTDSWCSGRAGGVDGPGLRCYRGCVRDTITIRPTIPKAELQKVSHGNLNKWINGLIERAVGERSAGWSEFMDQPRRRFKSQADEVRQASR
jgi:hypothetical protein